VFKGDLTKIKKPIELRKIKKVGSHSYVLSYVCSGTFSTKGLLVYGTYGQCSLVCIFVYIFIHTYMIYIWF